jgi:hypothetical protein
MSRPKVSSVYVLAPILTAVAILGGCSSTPPEANIVRQFFRASQLRDTQTLANFAVVTFDPKQNGVVTDFDVVSVSPERTEPLQVTELSKTVTEAEASNKAFTERKKAYQDKNMDAINRVIKAQAAGRRLSGADGKVQAEWEKWQAETAAEAKKVSAARTALADARPIAELSLASGQGDPPPIEQLQGNMVTKDVTINASVRAPDGATSQKQMVLTVQRAVVKGADGERAGKWIITSLKQA